ncbi:MAG: helix-turn-helix domain-containing protein [Peptostreptococcus sp.]|jgi:transcriptional regulator, arsR family|uniref:ArsR/SmtB family transcription factor n=1 Tax=Peptostreptococcus TaxID=1257 RepID=UPI001CAC4FEC|nr:MULTISPECIES: metalloregulator ArsR/SmtB family transcription factor [Peptostreptococcus]MBF1045570.1 helix-turn-helix domain-containing protein [Peptostreptococcus sp.]MBF1048083.1 helix-turn-helix domain-containing protein [Peptostreptococcus sp.]MBF1050469.1 helix-turn-helix domain-containing protein [Peptostreptococcus sp.]MBF1057274.1 helix-turn-helix domain-containing protein [Peptostreptococcus sp.]
MPVKKLTDDNIELCQEYFLHEDRLEDAREGSPTEEMVYDLVELFKVFGDVTRVKIIYALLESEMCVCDIASLLDMTQSAISHQLRVLKKARLVKFRKEGKTVFYSLDDQHIDKIFSFGLDHIKEMYY